MAVNRQCSRCGTALAASVTDGLCPACLMKQAIAPDAPTENGTVQRTGLEIKPLAAPMSRPAPGARIRYLGDYELIREIARGGMGTVWQAHQGSLNRTVALKMILGGQLATPGDVLRFRREAEAAANLQHQNIVAIHEIGEHQGQHYFSMDYVEGKNLAQVCGGKPLPAQRAARYVKIIAEAIHFAHQRGTLHRDLKPQNVLIDEHDQPRITDFGLAKNMSEESQLTMSGEVMGTPSYMAPEQAAGRREQVGPQTDVYALGAILYELLSGCRPFAAPTVMGTLQKVMETEPPPPRSLCPGVPADLETICLKCMEKVPARRYATAQALADDLERFLRDEPIHARPPGLLDRLDRWARQRPALAFTLLALAAFYLFHIVLFTLEMPGETRGFHWFVTGLLATWAVAAALFQRWTGLRPCSGLPTYCWAAFDVIMLTLFLGREDGPRSALLFCYPLLIAGAALRCRLGLLWLVTGLSAAAYLGLVLDAALRRPQFAVPFKHWVFFTVGLFILAFVQRLLLRRIRAASAGNL